MEHQTTLKQTDLRYDVMFIRVLTSTLYYTKHAYSHSERNLTTGGFAKANIEANLRAGAFSSLP